MGIQEPDWQVALQLVTSGKLDEARPMIENMLVTSPESENVNYVAGVYLFTGRNFSQASDFFRKTTTINQDNLDARVYLALSLGQTGTHRGLAECRDMLFGLMETHPELTTTHRLADFTMRVAAGCCNAVGPMREATRLWEVLAARTGSADDYYQLSEAYAQTDQLAEAEAALKKAIELNPEKYGKAIQQQTLQLIESARAEEKRQSVKKARYPETEIFRGDLKTLICDYIAVEHKRTPKFISRETAFFTMGSCFARNIAKALSGKGYNATHMEISEYINTTFANKYFVDWLEGSLTDASITERIVELLPAGFSKDLVIERIKQTNVFVLTLGVAPAFFDRHTGDFVMPRPTSLNMRALAEKYVYRTTTVADNVDNVLYLLSFIRKLSPGVKFVVTVSPVPLHMTFEFESAVVADCLSKSTMRLAAHEVVHNSGLKDIYYWPSFEIFRWAGSHAGPYFATDDGAAWHVSEAAVDTTIASFIEMLSVNS